MIDNILYSLNAVVPLILLIAIGFFLKRRNIFPQEFFNGIDKLVFNMALPVFIFNEISNAKIGEIFDIRLAVFCVCGIVAVFMSLMFLVPSLMRERFPRGAFIQGIYRGNFALLGVPLAGNLFGEIGSASAALIMPFAIPLFNIMAVVALAVNAVDSEDTTNRINFKKIFLSILKNPLIIAVALGIPFMFFKIMPAMLQKTISYVGGMSTPLALLSLGAGINIANLGGNRGKEDIKDIKTINGTKRNIKFPLFVLASLIRVVVLPIVFVTVALLMGFRDSGLVVIFVLFGTPTAVSSYIMAKNMKGDYELAGKIVVLTTVICPVTIFIGSFILRTIGAI